MNSRDGSAENAVTPTPEADKPASLTLQRGANGRYALTDTSGAWLEADAAAFVEIEQ
jgi:hypothetical protein